MATSGVVLSPVKDEKALYSHYSSFYGRGSLRSHEILISLAAENSLVPLRVFASDTIAHVKLRIQADKGLNVRQQRLVYGGKELTRNNSCVKDYGLSDGDVLHLVVRLSDIQAVTVKTAAGKKHVFQLERSRSVRELKHLISEREKDVELEDQELIFKGKQLEDKRRLDDLALENDIVVHLFVRKNVKVQEKTLDDKSFELSFDASNVKEEKPQAEAPIQSSPEFLGWPWTLQAEKPSDYRDKLLEYGGIVPKQTRRCLLEPLTASSKHKLSPTLEKMIKDVKEGLDSSHGPVCSQEGTGGAYFMKDTSGNKHIGVFKPIDEEPMAVNNPRGLPVSVDGEGLKKGTRVGEGAYREVAAYILDHPASGRRSLISDEAGFAGVPPTMMIRCAHGAFHYSEGLDDKEPKMGSLQQFVESYSNCEDMGPASFPVDEVHKLSVLDVRLANADRHGGNILVCRDSSDSSPRLVPIDHGYCLPESFEDCTFEWMYWPQAKQPYSEKTLKYIESLDAEKDIALLKYHGWTLSHECARVFRISTMLLKKGAAAGLTPRQIGAIMCRESLNRSSIIEKIVDEAHDAVLPASSEATFLETISLIMDRYIAQIKGKPSAQGSHHCGVWGGSDVRSLTPAYAT